MSVAPLVYPAKGFDCYAGTLTADVLSTAFDAGATFVVHYYGGSHGKDLTAASLKATSAAGMWCGAVFEGGGDNVGFFTSSQGADDAEEAITQAQAAGQPLGSAIYFAVDFGPQPGQLASNIVPYFGAVAARVRSAGYKVGAYACGTVLVGLDSMKLIDYRWLAGAMGWPGSRGYQGANMVQGAPPSDVYGLGFDVDPDTAYSEAGLFHL